MKLYRKEPPAILVRGLASEGGDDVRMYHNDDGLIILSSLDGTHHGKLKHLSMSRADRYPAWDEIVAVKEQLMGMEMDAMMVIPKRADYVNVHPNTFHVWQTPVEWGVL